MAFGGANKAFGCIWVHTDAYYFALTLMIIYALLLQGDRRGAREEGGGLDRLGADIKLGRRKRRIEDKTSIYYTKQGLV